jgi:hypothetical protein
MRHSLAQGLPVQAGSVLTTGSYAGMHFPLGSGLVLGRVEGLPPLGVHLT